LAVNIFAFTEPDEAKRTKSKEYDPVMCGPIKAIPEGYTNYDKVIVNVGSSLTFQQFIEYFKNKLNVEVTMVACGNVSLYNAYMPGGKHAARLPMAIEKVYDEICQEDKVKKNYLVLDIGGSTEDGADFTMPPIKYIFK